MARRVWIIIALLVAGCSSDDDKSVTNLIAFMNQYADAQAAKADKDKLAGLEAMVALSRKQFDELKISNEDRQKLLAKHRDGLDKALIRYLTAQGRRMYDVDKSNVELCDLYARSLANGAAAADELLKGLATGMIDYADARDAKSDQPALNALTCKLNAITKQFRKTLPNFDDQMKAIERNQAELERGAERWCQSQFGRSLKDMGGLFSGTIPGMPMIRK